MGDTHAVKMECGYSMGVIGIQGKGKRLGRIIKQFEIMREKIKLKLIISVDGINLWMG